MKQRRIRLLLLALLLLSAWAFTSPCSAQEYYLITPAELQTLEESYATLKTNNEKSVQELQVLKKQLTTSQEDCRKLTLQLNGLQSMSKAQEIALEQANKSLEQFEKEERSKLNKLKMQRNVGYFVAIVLGGILISK